MWSHLQGVSSRLKKSIALTVVILIYTVLAYRYAASSVQCIKCEVINNGTWFALHDDNTTTISYEENLKLLARSPRALCNCTYEIPFAKKHADKLIQSHCSSEATLMGGGQRVLSYSLYKPKPGNWKGAFYRAGILCNIRQMRALYPGWMMRVYTDVEPTDLCDIICEEDVFVCDVRNLSVLGYVTRMEPMTWRFLVLGDPTVTLFAVRDIDSQPTDREEAAVYQWIFSGMPFHGMRDHPTHSRKIYGGLWGGDNSKVDSSLTKKLLTELIQRSSNKGLWGYWRDMNVLDEVVYNQVKQLFLFHDSYHCREHGDSVPFPTQRSNPEDQINLFVGQAVPCYDFGLYASIPREKFPPCPKECRPAYGQDWELC